MEEKVTLFTAVVEIGTEEGRDRFIQEYKGIQDRKKAGSDD